MKRLRYGVIGLGPMGRLHVRLAHRNRRADVTAVADLDGEIAQRVAGRFGARGFASHREMLDAGLVDAVSIITSHDQHGPIGLDCLRAGVHVLVEKPLATRVSQADAMIEAAGAADLKLAVMHQYRTHRSSRAMKQLIESGTIGRIRRVLWTWAEFRPESYYAERPWRADYGRAGGGVLANQASHDLDLLCWMVGDPVRVTALAANHLHQAEIEDIVSAAVLFRCGAMASIQLSINSPKGYSTRQIEGDEGTIVVPDVQSLAADERDRILVGRYEDLGRAVGSRAGTHEQPPVAWRRIPLPGPGPVLSSVRRFLRRVGLEKKGPPKGHALLLDRFIDAVLDGSEPVVSGESARPAVELINAILLSAVRGRTVDLPVDRDECDLLLDELGRGKVRVPRLR